ncbi:TPA: hypothetical protein ACRHNS_RS06220, partial [Neisseria meningitidis]
KSYGTKNNQNRTSRIPACAGMTAQKLRNEKQPKPDKSDSRLRGNDGILSFRLCFLFSRE